MNETSTMLAAELGSQLASGASTARARFQDKTAAFSWCGETLVGSAAAYVAHGISGSTSTTAMRVSKTADSAAWDGKAAKAVTNTIVTENLTLSMYPGVVQVSTSHWLDSDNLGQAIQQSLYGVSLQAFDADLIGAAVAGADVSVSGVASAATIAQAQAAVMTNGFSPSLVILSPSDYGTIVGGSTSSLMVGGNDARETQLTIFGARMVVSAALEATQALVLDPSAMVAVEHSDSPVAMTTTDARMNSTDVVVELVATAYASKPDGICLIASE